MGKEVGPLEKCTKDGDLLRKQVDKIVKESLKNAGNKKLQDKELKLKENFKSCYHLKPQVTELLQRAEELSEENETGKVRNFETKKKKEIDRIQGWQTQIENAMTKLLPEEEREELLKELKKEAGEEEDESKEEEEEEEDSKLETTDLKTGEEGDEDEDDDEDDDDEEDEDDEEEEEEEEEESEEQPVVKKTTGQKVAEVVDEDEEDDDEEVEEEVEEEETEEEEEEEEEEDHKKVAKSKKDIKKAKVKAEEEEDDDEEEDEADEDEDDDEDDEDDEEDEDEEHAKGSDTEMEVTTTGRLFEALYDYDGQEKDDLSFKKGDILTIITTREDGWWEAEDDKGKKGNVPSTYLQLYNKYKDIQNEDEDEEDEDEEEDVEEEEETEEGEGGKKKMKRQRSGKELWKGIKKAVKETSVTDVLHAMGAVPSGFRLSTLGQKFNHDGTYQMKNYLAPKLSQSNFSYRDLFYDPSTSKIRPRLSREQRIVTIANCRQIPVPSAGLEVTGRHVRICLFDGHTVLSNIHTVKVASVDREQRTWSFSTRVNDLMDTYQHAEVFVRTNNTQSNIGILFEICASYFRGSTKEKGEFSCGWAHLPFEDEMTGAPIQNKTYDLAVHGGTPYEKGVEVDPSISRRTSTNAFMSLISGNKQPRLIVKLAVPKREQKEMLDTLPDTLIGNTSLLQMYSYYRQMLADTILRDRLDLESTELIHAPWLVTFPIVADQHDMMRLLRESWIEKQRSIRRAEMRDAEFMKDLFRKTIMESVYPLANSATLPTYRSGDHDNEQTRQQEINKFKHQKLSKNSILALLLSGDMSHKPLDLKEVSFNVIGPYCLSQHHNVDVPVEG